MQSTASIKNITKKFEKSEQSLSGRNVSKHNLKKEDEKPEFLKLNSKPVSERKNEKHGNNQKFLKQQLRPAVGRREEHEHTKTNICATGTKEKLYITKPPISSNKPTSSNKRNNLNKPVTEGKGEGECIKKTTVCNNSSIANKFSRDYLQNINERVFKVNQDHTDQSTEISRDGKNSAKFNVAFFENIMKENESSIKISKSNKPKTLTTAAHEIDNNLNENETKIGSVFSNFTPTNNFFSKSPNETVTCIDLHRTCLMSKIDGPTKKAIYEDVTEVILNETSSLYENEHSKKLSNIDTSDPNSVVNEDVYDDVDHSTQDLKQVLSNPKNQSIAENYVHNDVTFSVNVKRQKNEGMMDDSPTSLELPAKPDKSFLSLNKDQYAIPLGLEKWLQVVLAKNKHRLKTIVNFIPQQVPVVIRTNKPTFRRSFKAEEQEEMPGLLKAKCRRVC